MSVLRNLWREIGFFGFWKSAPIAALGCIPAHAAYFSVYEHSKDFFKINDGNQHFTLFALTGAMATSIHDIILTPFDGK